MTALVNNHFSELLGKRRAKITDVARETGISRTTLTKLYYQEGAAISFDVLRKLCVFFDCPVGDILFVEEPVEKKEN